MGADLISAVLEIDKNISPDWEKARSFIENMPDLDAMNLYSDILGLGEEFNDEDLTDPELKNSLDYTPEDSKQSFLSSLETCRLGWDNKLRNMNKIELQNSVILLAAGTSWGDNIPDCDEIYLFAGCGAAKAAGFY